MSNKVQASFRIKLGSVVESGFQMRF